jgi:O-antigen ligase
MRRRRLALTGLFWKIYGLVAIVPFLCVADQALGHFGMLPTSATLLCALALTPFVCALLAHHIYQRSLSIVVTPWSKNALPLIAFFLLAATALSLSAAPTAYWEEGGKWIFLLPYGFLITTLSIAAGTCRPVVQSLSLYSFLSLLLIGGSLWYEFTHPGTFSEINNRAAGFSGNANYTALVSVFVCSVGIDFGRPGSENGYQLGFAHGSHTKARGVWVDMVLLLTCFLIVVMTMSRSGLINFGVLAGSFVILRIFRSQNSFKTGLQSTLAVIFASAVVMTILPLLVSLIGAGGQNNRLARFMNNQQIDDGSAGTRLAAAIDCFRLIEEAPFLGHGTGFSRTMLELPHNLYLQQWVNNGIVGFVGYIVFLISAYLVFLQRNCRNGQVLVAIAAVGSLFSHNVLDQRPFLILLGILIAASLANSRTRDTLMSPPPRRSDSMRSLEPPDAWGGPATQRGRSPSFRAI